LSENFVPKIQNLELKILYFRAHFEHIIISSIGNVQFLAPTVLGRDAAWVTHEWNVQTCR